MSAATITLAPSLSPAGNARLPLLDAARTIAAIGVIEAHVLDELFPGNPLKLLGTFAVPFYLFVALYFTVRGLTRDPSRTLPMYLLGRVIKLYVPFLIWNVMYDLMHVAIHRHEPLTPISLLPWAAFYTHLYFLPFLLIATVLISLIARPLAVRPKARWIVSAILIVLAFAVGFSMQPKWLDDPMQIDRETLWNAYRAIPAALFAMAFALNAGIRPARVRTSIRVALSGLVLCVVCVLVQFEYGPFPILRSLSGFGLVLVAFGTIDHWLLRPLAWAGRLSFGVYLSHVVFIRLAMTLLHERPETAHPLTAVSIGAFAFFASLIFSALLARYPATRWIIGCETEAMRKRKQTLAADAVRPAATLSSAPATVPVTSPISVG